MKLFRVCPVIFPFKEKEFPRKSLCFLCGCASAVLAKISSLYKFPTQSAQTHRATYTQRDWKFSILLYTTGVTKNLKMCHRIPFIPWLQNHKTRPSQQLIETDLITGFARISTSWDSISMGRGKKVSIYWEEIEQESRFQKLDSS